MPLPKVGKKNRNEFIQFCMASDIMQREFPQQDKRFAVCKSIYDRKNKTKTEGEKIKWEEPDEHGFLLI